MKNDLVGVWLRRWMLLGCLALLAHAAPGQADEDAEKAFKAGLVGQQVYLRNFNGESKVQARWTGNAVQLDEPAARMLSSVLVGWVSVKGKKIEIDGDRYWVVKEAGKDVELVPLRSPVKVLVDIGNADVATVLPGLREALFFPDQATAFIALKSTPGWTAQVPSPKPPGSAAQRLPACDCADRGTDACKGKLPSTTPPKVLYAPSPDLSELGNRGKMTSEATLSMTVDVTGKPINVWVRRPLGGDLDDKAIRAMLQYRFAPAACHDKPVPVELFWQVNFQVF